MKNDELSALNKILHWLLKAGVVISCVLMLAGLGSLALSGSAMPHEMLTVKACLWGVLSFQPGALLTLGVLSLMITPILRVLVSMITFFHEKNWRFGGITLVVIVILMVSVVA